MEKENSIPVNLPYGKSKISVKIPTAHLAGIYTPKSILPAEKPLELIEQALSNLIDLPTIGEFIKPGKDVVILVDDHTRATPASLILPPLLTQLHKAGISEEHVTVMITHGTHRLSTNEEIINKVGDEVFSRYHIEQHSCIDEANQIYLGLTSQGTPVWINKLVVEADVRIGIGHIGPSPYAGYSGGYKLIVPGVAALDTINTNHSLVPLGLGLHGNIELPCRLDLEEAAAKVGMDMVVDVILSQDEKVLKVLAGKTESVFKQGVKLARKVYEVDCPDQVNISVSSAAPYDLDLYQAIRAIEYADAVVKPGGSMLLAAACPDGIGGDEFFELLADQNKQPEDFLRDVVRRNVMVTFSVLGYALASIKAGKDIYIVSDGIPDESLRKMGFKIPESMEIGINTLISRYGPQAKIAVFPRGATTIPSIS